MIGRRDGTTDSTRGRYGSVHYRADRMGLFRKKPTTAEPSANDGALAELRSELAAMRERLDAEPRPFVIDVGSNLAHGARAHIPGAMLLDLDAVARADDLPDDRDIVLYCACPNEESARRAAQLLMRKGYRRVRPLVGGFDAWSAAGHPVEHGARDLLDHQHGGQRVGAGTAVLLGHVRGVEVGREQRLGRLTGVAGLLVHDRGVRRHLGVAQVTDGLADGLVLLGEGVEVAHAIDSTSG